jgi:hypothetical protein
VTFTHGILIGIAGTLVFEFCATVLFFWFATKHEITDDAPHMRIGPSK